MGDDHSFIAAGVYTYTESLVHIQLMAYVVMILFKVKLFVPSSHGESDEVVISSQNLYTIVEVKSVAEITCRQWHANTHAG